MLELDDKSKIIKNCYVLGCKLSVHPNQEAAKNIFL